LPDVAYPGVRDNRSTVNTKTGYDMMMSSYSEISIVLHISVLCARLLDVVSGQRTHHELQLMLIFEHVDQDLAQYLEKNTAGLSPECIQACTSCLIELLTGFLCRCFFESKIKDNCTK